MDFRVKFDVKESFHGLFILFYFINGTSLMGTLFQMALYFKKYFSIGLFVAVCLCLLKTEIKQEKLLLSNYLLFIITATVFLLLL